MEFPREKKGNVRKVASIEKARYIRSVRRAVVYRGVLKKVSL